VAWPIGSGKAEEGVHLRMFSPCSNEQWHNHAARRVVRGWRPPARPPATPSQGHPSHHGEESRLFPGISAKSQSPPVPTSFPLTWLPRPPQITATPGLGPRAGAGDGRGWPGDQLTVRERRSPTCSDCGSPELDRREVKWH
jgi:hypothetical protein